MIVINLWTIHAHIKLFHMKNYIIFSVCQVSFARPTNYDVTQINLFTKF